jgi:hypothetical protein
MAIAENPDKAGKNRAAVEAAEDKFIGAATARTAKEAAPSELVAVNMRLNPETVERAGRAARRLGISKTGFFALAAVEKLEELGM